MGALAALAPARRALSPFGAAPLESTNGIAMNNRSPGRCRPRAERGFWFVPSSRSRARRARIRPRARSRDGSLMYAPKQNSPSSQPASLSEPAHPRSWPGDERWVFSRGGQLRKKNYYLSHNRSRALLPLGSGRIVIHHEKGEFGRPAPPLTTSVKRRLSFTDRARGRSSPAEQAATDMECFFASMAAFVMAAPGPSFPAGPHPRLVGGGRWRRGAFPRGILPALPSRSSTTPPSRRPLGYQQRPSEVVGPALSPGPPAESPSAAAPGSRAGWNRAAPVDRRPRSRLSAGGLWGGGRRSQRPEVLPGGIIAVRLADDRLRFLVLGPEASVVLNLAFALASVAPLRLIILSRREIAAPHLLMVDRGSGPASAHGRSSFRVRPGDAQPCS